MSSSITSVRPEAGLEILETKDSLLSSKRKEERESIGRSWLCRLSKEAIMLEGLRGCVVARCYRRRRYFMGPLSPNYDGWSFVKGLREEVSDW